MSSRSWNIEKRFAAVGLGAVGAAGHFHLQDAEIDAHLEFGLTVVAADFADVDGARLVIPALEDGGNVGAGHFAFIAGPVFRTAHDWVAPCVANAAGQSIPGTIKYSTGGQAFSQITARFNSASSVNIFT